MKKRWHPLPSHGEYNQYGVLLKYFSTFYSVRHINSTSKFYRKNVITPSSWKACKMAAMSRKTTTRTWYYRLHWSCHKNEVNGNIFITLVVYVKHMTKSKWMDCQGNEFFPKQKGTPSLVKIEHKNTATLDSARSKKNLKSQFCNYGLSFSIILPDPLSSIIGRCTLYTPCCRMKAYKSP